MSLLLFKCPKILLFFIAFWKIRICTKITSIEPIVQIESFFSLRRVFGQSGGALPRAWIDRSGSGSRSGWTGRVSRARDRVHKRGQKRVAAAWHSVAWRGVGEILPKYKGARWLSLLIRFLSRVCPPCAKLFSTMRVQKSKGTESERGRACSKNKRRAHRAAFYAPPWRGREADKVERTFERRVTRSGVRAYLSLRVSMHVSRQISDVFAV